MAEESPRMRELKEAIMEALADGQWAAPMQVWRATQDKNRWPLDLVKPTLMELWEAGQLDHWHGEQSGGFFFRRTDVEEPENGRRPV